MKRIEAVLEIVGKGENLAVDANGRFDLDTALAYGKAMQPYGSVLVRGARRPARLPAQRRARAISYPGALATGENLFSMQDGRNLIRYGGMRPDRDWMQLDPALSLRPDGIPRVSSTWWRQRLVAPAAHPARWPSARAQHRRRPADRRLGKLSRRLPALRRLRRRYPDRRRLRAPARGARHRHRAKAHHVRRNAQAFGVRLICLRRPAGPSPLGEKVPRRGG